MNYVTANLYNKELGTFQTYFYDFRYKRFLLSGSRYFKNTPKKLFVLFNPEIFANTIINKLKLLLNTNNQIEVFDLDIRERKFSQKNVIQDITKIKLI